MSEQNKELTTDDTNTERGSTTMLSNTSSMTAASPPLSNEKQEPSSSSPVVVNNNVHETTRAVENSSKFNSNSNSISNSNSNSNFAQNPGMTRIQAALQTQLQNTYERVKYELLEKEEALRESKQQREDCGVELYGVQQQLARLQGNLEGLEQTHDLRIEQRKGAEESVQELEERLMEQQAQMGEIKQHRTASQNELDALYETIRQIKTYNEDMKSEISVTKRAAQKTEETMKVLEKGKMAQDVYIDKLNEQTKCLEADIALSQNQLEAQQQQTQNATQALQETNEELDYLVQEKKQLMQQWNSSIVALNRRDEALLATGKAYKEAKEKSEAYKIESNAIRKEIQEADTKQETMISIQNRFENEIIYLEESLQKIQNDKNIAAQTYETLQQSIATSNEEESKIASITQKITRQTSGINHKIEAIMKERHSIEEQIGLNLHETSTYSKATKNLFKEDKGLLKKIHEKEIEAANIHNELARIKIDTINTKTHNSQLQEKLVEATDELKVKDKETEQLEIDVRRRNNEIETKMNNVDRLNRKYEKMVESTDDPEPLGPLEGAIKSLKREIETKEGELQQTQRHWLMDQSKLVQIIGETNATQERNAELNARLNILSHKKLRILQNIHTSESQSKSIKNNMSGMHKDMARLNDLISETSKTHVDIMNENTIKQKEFQHELKDLEAESNEIEKRINDAKEAKDQIINDIIEVQRQVLTWEKKIQLEKETRNALDSSEEMKEIKGMEKEIHRMKHRLSNIDRDQESIIREMEQAIYRKEDIAVKFSNKNDSKGGSKKKSISSADLKRKSLELKENLNQINKMTEEVTNKIETCKQELREIILQLEDATQKFDIENNSNKELQDTLHQMLFQKQSLLAKTDRHEEMIQYYKDLDDGKIQKVDCKKDVFQVEKKMVESRAQLKRIQSVISGLRIKHRDLDEVLGRVASLASDVMKDLDYM